MIKHTHTEPSTINFSKLENRILNANSSETIFNFQQSFLTNKITQPTLLIATGGSLAIAYYLQILLESRGVITEVIEPRTYFYKKNIASFKNLIAISTSGKTNGIEAALNDFKGNKYLISKNPIGSNKFTSIPYGNDLYQDEEKSFVSLSSTFGPMALILSMMHSLEESNNKIKEFLQKSRDIISELEFNFKNSPLIEIISGYDTKTAATILESNLVETGSAAPIIHDKGSYCHGRSNLIF